MFLETWLESTKGCNDPELGACRLAEFDQLLPDLASGDLPPVTFIDPQFGAGITESSEHPPANPHHGQQFVWQVVNALTKSPLWKRSVLFITYDEHGGFADSVPPPKACHPGDKEPVDETDGTFDQLGFRVPMIVVSPYAKKGFVSHVTRDHTAILRFIQAKHGIGAFSKRDANSDALMDLFDFQAPPHATPPTFTEPNIDPAKVDACKLAFPGGK
jgi:phospholipase C